MDRRDWKFFVAALLVVFFFWLGTAIGGKQEPPAKKETEEKKEAAPRPKSASRNYVLAVVLVNAADGSAVEAATVRVSYGGQEQSKPASGGNVTFRFRTDAAEAMIRINAPGTVIYNKTIQLKQEKLEHRAELAKSD